MLLLISENRDTNNYYYKMITLKCLSVFKSLSFWVTRVYPFVYKTRENRNFSRGVPANFELPAYLSNATIQRIIIQYLRVFWSWISFCIHTYTFMTSTNLMKFIQPVTHFKAVCFAFNVTTFVIVLFAFVVRSIIANS